MGIAPFSFREFGESGGEVVPSIKSAKSFLPQGKKREETPPPPPPPPTFSEDQMKAAERDGYQKGFLDGITEGKNQAENTQAQIDAELSTLVETFAANYAPMFALYREMLAHQAKFLPQIAYAIAKKVASDALSENASQSVENIAMRCVESMSHEPKLVITIHESMSDTLAKKIASARHSLQMAGEVMVIGDANIAKQNCRIEWKDGAMVRDTESLWQQVEHVVTSMITSAERESHILCEQLNPAVISGESQDQG